MKTLTGQHTNTSLKIGKNLSNFSTYSCKPETKYELVEIIGSRIDEDGLKCDLNDIDTSLITDMSWLFYDSKFNGNISNWNVSNVTDMAYMFKDSFFDGDISKWDVSNVESMESMFYKSKFNQDISNWKISKDCVTYNMFDKCPIKEEYKPKTLQ